MRITRLLSLAFPLLLAPAAAAAQAGNSAVQSDSAITTLHVFSRETVVDVVVLDPKGHPISGLQRSEFQIKEDGKPQPIRSFSESGAAIPRGKPRQLPPLFHTNYAPAPLTGPANIILIDAMHMSPVMVARATQATAAYLHSMPEGTQVALMWISITGLHVAQGFTSDRDLLLRAIDQQRFDIGSSGYNHAWITVDALTQLAQYLAPIKGRKNLLWITRGMPVPLLRDGGYGDGDQSFPAGLAAMNKLPRTQWGKSCLQTDRLWRVRRPDPHPALQQPIRRSRSGAAIRCAPERIGRSSEPRLERSPLLRQCTEPRIHNVRQ